MDATVTRMDGLLDRTYKLLEASPLTLGQIAAESGIGEHWLRKFHQGKPPNPGVRTVQKLHDYLAAEEEKPAA